MKGDADPLRYRKPGAARPAKARGFTPLLRYAGIVFTIVCWLEYGAAATQTGVTFGTVNPNFPENLAIHLAYGEDSGINTMRSEDHGVVTIAGQPSQYAMSNLDFQVGTTATHLATVSEGGTLTMLVISAFGIALIVLRRRRCGTNYSQDSTSSARPAHEGHLTNSYDVHSPHDRSEATSSGVLRQHSIERRRSCSGN